MELEAQWEDARHSSGKKILDQLGAFAPAFGMIGTLVGLVQMLQDLSNHVEATHPNHAHGHDSSFGCHSTDISTDRSVKVSGNVAVE